LFGMKKVLYRRNPKFFLPIYKNGDAIHIYDERSKLPLLSKKMPCPHCGKLVYECDMHYEEHGAARLAGCSIECARLASKLWQECSCCKKLHYVNDMHSVTDSGTRQYVCRKCYRDNSVPCDSCNNMVLRSSTVEVGDLQVCQSCARNYPKCAICTKRTHRDLLVTVNGLTLCTHCIKKNDLFCEVCRTVSQNKCKTVSVGGRNVRVCKECLEPAPGTDLGNVK
jgi:hypothetical protein